MTHLFLLMFMIDAVFLQHTNPHCYLSTGIFKKIYIYIYIRKAELIVKHVGAFDMHFMVLITVLISMKYGMDILYFVCFLPCWSFNNVYYKYFSALHET